MWEFLPDNRLGDDEALYTRELQQYLRRISQETEDIPLIAIDGVYGPETRDAVAAFQEVYGLPVTGNIDRRTWEAIYEEFLRITESNAPAERIDAFDDSNPRLTIGSRGKAVAILQLMLDTIALRYINIDRVPPGEMYDERTSTAVGQFQRLARLPVTGETDKRTWNAIVRHFNQLV